MIDLILSFPSFEVATQIGILLGYTTVDDIENPQVIETQEATPDGLSICVIGEHQIPSAEVDEDGNTVFVGDGKWWVMVRSMQDIELPQEITPFITWHSKQVDNEGNLIPQPTNDPLIPVRMWA